MASWRRPVTIASTTLAALFFSSPHNFQSKAADSPTMPHGDFSDAAAFTCAAVGGATI